MLSLTKQIVTLILSLTVATTSFAVIDTQVVTDRCQEDLISYEHRSDIPQRWEWSKKCDGGQWGRDLVRAYTFLNDDMQAWTSPNDQGPGFPVYTSGDYIHTWVAPKDGNAPCDRPPFANGFKILLCHGGCLLGNQKVLFSDGYYLASDALALLKSDVVTLASDATTDNLRLQTNHVREYHTDVMANPRNEYLTLTTAAGTSIKVTPNHPLVDGSGTMVRASDLKPGDTLLHVSGRRDAITAVTSGVVFEKVINLEPITQQDTSKIYIVNGYLSGSISQQRRSMAEVNRVLFRDQLENLAN